MKRILSIILSVAMLASMASMTVFGWGAYEDQITTKNVMLITPDKDSYATGDTVVITATMESIWGDPTIEDDIEGWEGDIMAGAYGMNIICANLIYDTSVFTAQKHTLLYEDSDILNVDASVTENCNTVKEAEANGAYYMSIISDIYNADGDEWGFFNGSGDLWQWKFTIAEDAKPGTYYLPVGPYRICRDGDPGSIPDIIFGDEGLDDRVWTWNGNTDSLLIDREIEYKTNYDGPSRVAENSPKGTEYECGYVEIVIEGEGGPVNPPAPPVVEDPMSIELVSDKEGTALVPGDTVTVSVNVKNNETITNPSLDILFNNTALKLVDVASPVADFGTADVNYTEANKLGTFDKVGQSTTTYAIFPDNASYTEDGTVVTITFEVLATAEGGDSVVSVSLYESGLDASANIAISGEHKHSFTETTTPADCERAGKVEQICPCGLIYMTASMSKLNCTPDLDNPILVPATCERDGQKAWNCTACGKLAKNEIIPSLGHDWKTVTTEVSCTTDATSQDVCQRCGKTTELVIEQSALKHIDPATGMEAWGEPYILRKPTTNTVGMWAKDCALCKSAWEYESIPILDVMLGDSNMDGKINLEDVSLLLKAVAKWENLYFSTENGDVAGDGRINAMDVSRLMKYVAGWENIILGDPPTSV